MQLRGAYDTTWNTSYNSENKQPWYDKQMAKGFVRKFFKLSAVMKVSRRINQDKRKKKKGEVCKVAEVQAFRAF